MSQFWKLVAVPLLVAGMVGCGAHQAVPYEGRLDVEIRPDSAGASLRQLEGSLALRTDGGRLVDRLPIVNPYDTLSVALAEGAYLLEWQPIVAFPSEPGASAPVTTGPALRTPFSVIADRVTTVRARVVITRDDAPELAALVTDPGGTSVPVTRVTEH